MSQLGLGRSYRSSDVQSPVKIYKYPKQVHTFNQRKNYTVYSRSKQDEALRLKNVKALQLSNDIGNANAERLRNDYLGVSGSIPQYYNKFDELEDMTTKIEFAKRILNSIMNTKEIASTIKWLQDSNLIDAFIKFGSIFAKHSPKNITSKEFQTLWAKVDTAIENVIAPTRSSMVATIPARVVSPEIFISTTKSVGGTPSRSPRKAYNAFQTELMAATERRAQQLSKAESDTIREVAKTLEIETKHDPSVSYEETSPVSSSGYSEALTDITQSTYPVEPSGSPKEILKTRSGGKQFYPSEHLNRILSYQNKQTLDKDDKQKLNYSIKALKDKGYNFAGKKPTVEEINNYLQTL